MKTDRGIYYDLKESDYIYIHGSLELHFSSLFYLTKYSNEIDEYIKLELFKLKQRYSIYVDLTDVLYLSLYLKIEKRGFYVKYNGKTIDRDNVKFITELFE